MRIQPQKEFLISDVRDALSMRRLHVKDTMKEYGQLRVCGKMPTAPNVKAESPFRLPTACIIPKIVKGCNLL